MGFFFGRNKGRGIPKNAAFRLTQEGEAKLDNYSGDARSQVLMALKVRGSSDTDEIAEASGLSRGQVESVVRRLLAGGYVQYVSASMGVETD